MSDFLLSSYEKMYLLRRMEEELVKYYYDNKVMSFVHFYVGQEAVAVGVCQNLQHEDRVFGNHRSHGHYLAKGGNPEKMVAELLGRSTGCAKGAGGSMHMIDKSVNFMGSTPILGSVAPISAGSAFQQKMSKSPNITVGFLGDGASEEGVVYETYNFAALFKLPLLLVIENNLYSVMSKLADRRGEKYDLAAIASGYGVQYYKADGNNFLDVSEKAKTAIEQIKSGSGPVILECVVYRHMAHSAPLCDDKLGYRYADDNPSNRADKDSVKLLRLEVLKSFNEVIVRELESKIETIVQDSIKFAVSSPYPEPSELMKNVHHE